MVVLETNVLSELTKPCTDAAVARSRGASVATRNVRDFEGCGVALVDAWSS